MTKFLKIGTILVLGFTLFQVFAQISQLSSGKGNLLSPIVFSSLPRTTSQSIDVKANFPTRTSVLIEPNYESYAKFISPNPLFFRVFKPDGTEAQATSDTFTQTERVQSNLKIYELKFSVNADDGLWELELTSNTDSLVPVLSGNQVSGGTALTLAIQNSMSEVGTSAAVIVEVPNFDSGSMKLTVDARSDLKQAGTTIEVHDDGLGLDENANDGHFTGPLPTNVPGNYHVVAFMDRRTRLGNFIRTEIATKPFTVYERTAHVVDTPSVSVVSHPILGTPDQLEVSFDLEVFAAARYETNVYIGSDQGSQPVSLSNTLPTENQSVPYYGVGTHRVVVRGAFRRNSDILGQQPIQFRLEQEGSTRVIEQFISQMKTGFTQQQLFPKRFAGYNGDKLVDQDNDGEPDALEVSFNVNVYKAGIYTWDASLRSPKDNQETENVSGPLGVGSHTLKVNIPLTDNLWREQINGRFRISFGMVNNADDQDQSYLNDVPQDLFSQTYNLASSHTLNPTIDSLKNLIFSAKLLRPGEGIRAELLESIAKIDAVKASKDSSVVYTALSDFLELFKAAQEKYFSKRNGVAVSEIWSKLYEINKTGGVLK
jgi:hypothetical protein